MRERNSRRRGMELMTTATAVQPTELKGLSQMSAEDLDLARIIFSRCLCETKNRTSPTPGSSTQMRDLGKLLSYYANISFARDGIDYPATAPAVEANMVVPLDPTALKRLEIDTLELRAMWSEAVRRDGFSAKLPDRILLAFTPEVLWPVVLAVVSDGPGISASRVELALGQMASRPAPVTRRRPQGGALAQNSINKAASSFRRLQHHLVQIRHHTTHEGFGGWVSVARFNAPEGPLAPTENAAPPWHQVRAQFRRIDDSARLVLGATCASDELEIVARMSPSAAKTGKGGKFKKLRDRAWFGTMLVIGARIGAVNRLRCGDLVADHRQHNGTVGPALALRPWKGKRTDEVAWKPIPEELHMYLRVYLAFCEKAIGRPLKSNEPLFMKGPKNPDAPWATWAMRRRLAGCAPSPAEHLKKGAGQLAMLPRDIERDPYYGFGPHEVRAAVAQAITSNAAVAYSIAEGHRIGNLLLCEALEDRAPVHDQNGYLGVKKPQEREAASGQATSIVWAMLTTDLGGRKIRDADEYRRALQKRQALLAEQDRLHRSLDVAHQESAGLTVEQMMERLLSASKHGSELRQIGDELRNVEIDLHSLRKDDDRLVCVPDDQQSFEAVDLDVIDREVLKGLGSPRAAAKLEPVRDWITPPELAQILGVGPATVRRWIGEGRKPPRLPHPDGDPRNPWRLDAVPVCSRLGPRRKRLSVALISGKMFDTDSRRASLARTLSRPPEGWGKETLAAPLTPASPNVNAGT